MGRITTIYGYIKEYPQRRDSHTVARHNQKIIDRLPIEANDYPYLMKSMFHVPKGRFENIIYHSYWSRVITFGGSFKGLEDHWEEWLVKFEKLLTQLIWYEAKVHIETEWCPEQVCEWRISHEYSNKINSRISPHELTPITKNDWKFQGLRDFDLL